MIQMKLKEAMLEKVMKQMEKALFQVMNQME